jgi:hypothetical protein
VPTITGRGGRDIAKIAGILRHQTDGRGPEPPRLATVDRDNSTQRTGQRRHRRHLEHVFYHQRVAWRKRWWVHIWSGGLGVGSMADDRERVRQVHVNTVVALHDLLTEVRADPTVRRWAYGPFDELDTAGAPAHCACGRELKGLRGYAAEYRRRPCIDCPGHDEYRCRGCGHVTMWPVPGPECRPSTVDRQRRPPPYPSH